MSKLYIYFGVRWLVYRISNGSDGFGRSPNRLPEKGYAVACRHRTCRLPTHPPTAVTRRKNAFSKQFAPPRELFWSAASISSLENVILLIRAISHAMLNCLTLATSFPHDVIRTVIVGEVLAIARCSMFIQQRVIPTVD